MNCRPAFLLKKQYCKLPTEKILVNPLRIPSLVLLLLPQSYTNSCKIQTPVYDRGWKRNKKTGLVYKSPLLCPLRHGISRIMPHPDFWHYPFGYPLPCPVAINTWHSTSPYNTRIETVCNFVRRKKKKKIIWVFMKE